jgi:hypothetical protein
MNLALSMKKLKWSDQKNLPVKEALMNGVNQAFSLYNQKLFQYR